MRRRDFLGGALAAGALGLPRVAGASDPWGTGPREARDLLLPAGVRAEKCLEVFLYGGMGPFESFYVVEEFGRPDDPVFPSQQWHLFADDHEAEFADGCGWTGPWLEPFALDSAGRTVNLGPVVQPLRDRPDLVARMRVVVMQHDLLPHEAAIPLALSGQRLGSARMCGLGAHVQRFVQEREGGTNPHAYLLSTPFELATDNLRAATAVGLHPGSARPLGLTISSETAFPSQLERATVGRDRRTVDALRAHLDGQLGRRYADALGADLRSRALADHTFALETLRSSPRLAELLVPELFARQGGASCATERRTDLTTMSLHAAVTLLADPTSGARYVNVVDGGLVPAAGGGTLDTHEDHLGTHARNLSHTLRQLAARINAPGEGDPGKLDLDETVVVLTCDFGRTPIRQDGSRSGTNHHPYGYVQVLLGGPIGPDQAGLVGEIGPDAVAADFATPAEFRIGVMASLGMYPFSTESFAVGDVRGAGSELDALRLVQERILGRSA